MKIVLAFVSCISLSGCMSMAQQYDKMTAEGRAANSERAGLAAKECLAYSEQITRGMENKDLRYQMQIGEYRRCLVVKGY